MDILGKLDQLMEDRGWTAYRLAKNSELSESTIANIVRRGTVPSFPTLEAICNGLGITLSQFFAEDEMVELTPDLKELFDAWHTLSPFQKTAALQMIQAMSNKK